MKRITVLFVLAFILQSCAGSNSSNSGGGADNPPGSNPPGAQPGTESTYFDGVDSNIADATTGDLLVAERFTILMSRLSVYALICDFKDTKGYSAQFSKLYNDSTSLQKNSIRVYGSEPAANNRFEKQRNIESNRLSFQSGPNACAEGLNYFTRYMKFSASDLETQLKTAARGTL